MKKSKFLKILAPIVALGLLIGALFTVSASATTDEGEAEAKAPEIISMNVEYGSELYLYYAVDKGDAEGAPKLEVLSDAEGTAVEYTVKSYTTETVHDKECYVFKTKGVAPKDLNKVQYVRAVVGEEASEIKAASVELYLYTRLYKNGFAAKTAADNEDYTRRNLYYQLLKYAHSAQALIYANESFEEIGGPAIMISGAEGLASGKIDAPYFALNAAEVEGKSFSYWKVDVFSVFGEFIHTKLFADGYEFVNGGNCAVVTPVYDEEITDDVQPWDPDMLNFDRYKPGFTTNNVVEGVSGMITADPENPLNNVYAFVPSGKTLTWVYQIDKATIPADANVAIVEYRIWLGAKNATGGNVINTEMYFCDAAYTSQKSEAASFFYLNSSDVHAYRGTYYDEDGKVKVKHDSVKTVASGAVAGTWNDIRIEYRVKEADGVKTPEWKVYVNGVLKITYENMYGARYFEREGEDSGVTLNPHTLIQERIPKVTDIHRISINSSSSIPGGMICYDDVKIYHIAE